MRILEQTNAAQVEGVISVAMLALINSTRPGVAIKAVCVAAICLVCNDILLL